MVLFRFYVSYMVDCTNDQNRYIDLYDRRKCTNLTIVNVDVTKLVEECISLVKYTEAS